MATETLRPGTRVEVLCGDPQWNYQGIVRRIRKGNEGPTPDWHRVEEIGAVERIGRRAHMMIHRDGLRVISNR